MKFEKINDYQYKLIDTYLFNKEIDDVINKISGNSNDYSELINLTLKEHIGSRILSREFNNSGIKVNYDNYPYINILADLNGTERIFTLGKIKENKEDKYLNGVLII